MRRVPRARKRKAPDRLREVASSPRFSSILRPPEGIVNGWSVGGAIDRPREAFAMRGSLAAEPGDPVIGSVAAVDGRLASHARIPLPEPGDDAGDSRKLKTG